MQRRNNKLAARLCNFIALTSARIIDSLPLPASSPWLLARILASVGFCSGARATLLGRTGAQSGGALRLLEWTEGRRKPNWRQ